MLKNNTDIITIRTETINENSLKSFCYLNINKTINDKLYYLMAILDISFEQEEIVWSLIDFKWSHYVMSDNDWLEGMPIENWLDYHNDSDINTEEIISFMSNEEVIARIIGESDYFDKEK